MGIATSSPRRSNRRVSERSSLSRRSSQSMTSGITFECFKLLIWTISNLLSNRSNILTHNLEHPCSKSAPNKGGLIFPGFAFQNERSRRLHVQEVVWPRRNRRLCLWGQTSIRRRNHRTYTMSCTFTRLLEHSSLRMESNFLNISFYYGIWRYFCKRKRKKRKSKKKSGKKRSRKQKRQRTPPPAIDLTNIWVSYPPMYNIETMYNCSHGTQFWLNQFLSEGQGTAAGYKVNN